MRRRQFIVALGGMAAMPHIACAQQQAMPVIGFLGSESSDSLPGQVTAFAKALGLTMTPDVLSIADEVIE